MKINTNSVTVDVAITDGPVVNKYSLDSTYGNHPDAKLMVRVETASVLIIFTDDKEVDSVDVTIRGTAVTSKGDPDKRFIYSLMVIGHHDLESKIAVEAVNQVRASGITEQARSN